MINQQSGSRSLRHPTVCHLAAQGGRNPELKLAAAATTIVRVGAAPAIVAIGLLLSPPACADSSPSAARIENNASTSQYLRIADSPSLEPQELTIELRFTPLGPGSGNSDDQFGSALFAKPAEGAGGLFLTSYGLFWSPVTNQILGTVAHDIGSVGVFLFSEQTVPVGASTHLALTFDGATMSLYINGALDVSAPFPYPGIDYGAQDVLVGGANACCGFLRRFDGTIDDVRLWDVAKSGEEIAASMNTEVAGPMPGLLGAWNFNCSDFRDVSGNGHTATAIGGVGFVPQDPNLNPPPPVFGDLNSDCAVDGADLGILLSSWGPCEPCKADLNGDGVVDGADLGLLLSAWASE